jgi:hypothetical protein
VKKWGIAWAVAVLASGIVLFTHSTAADLLADSDTAVLLSTIRAKNAPFSWFLSDWPLYNHFYRPIPTLAFEMDSRLYGNNPAGYAWTNAALAAGCVLALFWFLREFINRPLAAAGGALLFASWQWNFFQPNWNDLVNVPIAGLDIPVVPLAILIVGRVRHRRNWRAYVPAAVICPFLAYELMPIEPLGARVVEWLPGRTASCMTLFALAAMAAYARYERLGSRIAPPLDPMTPPATRSSQFESRTDARWPWAVASVPLAALAFASYEQAVMLPACMLGCAIAFYWMGYRPTWSLHAAFWCLLAAYVALRHAVIPPGVSHYQNQQIRTTNGAFNSLLDFVWPISLWQQAYNTIESLGVVLLFQPSVYWILIDFWSAAESVVALRKEWILAVAGLGLSIIAFMPMAWLKIFNHYYYWPLALRTVFTIALVSVFWRLASRALRAPEIQAPKRSTPAPGSLTA